LDEVDTILCPSASSIAPKIETVLNGGFSSTYADNLLCLANFAGTPSITIPFPNIGKMP
jgi:Asp-tRNA(Asn)/Glu-tRNA(Gln) amidotransferase A subunit family amidase